MHYQSQPMEQRLRDPFERVRANDVVVMEGYSAPYLYLLDELEEAPAKPVATKRAKSYSQRKLEQVERSIRAGHGQGRGDLYKPWIHIRRGHSSPVSNQVYTSVSIQSRNHHFLSKLEASAAVQLAYLGATELRECLPMWPYEHLHPNADLDAPSHTALQLVPGLMDIAREAGIEHGCFVGTNVPYVGTIDLMFAFPAGDRPVYLGVSCKPRDILDASTRAQERVELHRLYCNVVGARHFIEDATAFKSELLRNLYWLRPLTSEVREHRNTARLHDFAERFNELALHMPLSAAAVEVGAACGMGADEAYRFMRIGIWLHLIDIDLTEPVRMTRSVTRGSAKVLNMLRARYLGGCHA